MAGVVVLGGEASEIAGPPDGPEVAAFLAGQGGAVLDVTSTEEFLGEVLAHTETSTTTTTTVGPATILIGKDQSQTYFVPAGTVNVNTNTHTEYFLDARYRRVTTITVEPAAVSPRFTG
jgi:hypothetical protein